MENNTNNNPDNGIIYEQPVPPVVNEQGNGTVNNNFTPYTQDTYIPPKYRKEKQPVLAAVLAFLIMLAFLGIQFVVMIPYMMGAAINTVTSADVTALNSEELTKELIDSVDSIGLTLLATVVSAIVAVIWYKFAYCRGVGFTQIKGTVKTVCKDGKVFGIILAGIGIYYLSNWLILLIELISPDLMDQYYKLIEMSGFENADWKIIILTVLIAPINEECIMRGLIFKKLKLNMAPIAAIIISAIYFGIFHMNLVQGIYAAFIGLFMAYLANKYNSIIPSILFHAVFNGFNYVLAALPQEFSENIFILAVVPLVSLCLWYFLEGKRKIE
ncbi:MAG: CPBP family intramembrane metalloprotease [Lachnospiraceae bacterium]|nr:CPBP family intramembrane metalloprotease [Lachnospiraceae bacterium]